MSVGTVSFPIAAMSMLSHAIQVAIWVVAGLSLLSVLVIATNFDVRAAFARRYMRRRAGPGLGAIAARMNPDKVLPGERGLTCRPTLGRSRRR